MEPNWTIGIPTQPGAYLIGSIKNEKYKRIQTIIEEKGDLYLLSSKSCPGGSRLLKENEDWVKFIGPFAEVES